jgi:hypothetical protein
MPYESHLPEVTDRFERAERARLLAGAEVVLAHLIDRHVGGYTSGDFVTGHVINSLRRGDVERGQNGELLVRVGTTQTDPPYPVYWTLGHQNLFTGNYERVDHWTPAVADAAVPATEAGNAAFAAVWGA